MISKIIDLLSEKKNIILLGFGKEGRSTYNFIRKHLPEKQVCIADRDQLIAKEGFLQKNRFTKLELGEGYLQNIEEYDLIIKSPGIKLVKVSGELQKRITSQTELFLHAFGSQTIGVTGTKGKSTTVSMIKHILDNMGISSFLIGNIGVPALDMVSRIAPEDTVVYELSAHQLEFLVSSPHISILLNIFPEHLDYFNSFSLYKNAKFNIFKYLKGTDRLIVNSSLEHELGAVNTNVTLIDNNISGDIENIPALGIHNKVNAEFAIAAAFEIGVSREDAIQSLLSFKSLPHRLEMVVEGDEITFINDSISTIPESAIAALETLNKVDILILGGYDRGLDYSKLADYLIGSTVRAMIFLGKAGMRIKELVQTSTNKDCYVANNLENAFDIINDIRKYGDVCLLSPAAASYDQFKNFEHRGDKFKELSEDFQKS